MSLPTAPACERNRGPILAVLRETFARATRVLEIGSGTGQHAVFFGAALPHLVWQCSDLAVHHAGIRAWIAHAGVANVLPPIALDVAGDAWPRGGYDAAFSANTAHIMSWSEVGRMFAGLATALEPGSPFCLYGPFAEGGRHTSESNARFDARLRAEAPQMGVRDRVAVVELAAGCGFAPAGEHAMPAHNRLLVFRSAAGPR